MGIPKIIHYCWFGRTPLPDLAYRCIASWREYLPDYKIVEWNEDNFNVDAIAYTREAYKLKKYAFVSDYARFWILYNYGGVYFDTDVEIIKPIDDIIEKGPFMGMECVERADQRKKMMLKGVAPGLGLGATHGIGIYKEILHWYNHHHYATWTGKWTGNVVEITSCLLSQEPFEKMDNGILKFKDIYVYPAEYFCPINYWTGERRISSNTRTIHHYAATWVEETFGYGCRIRRRLKYFMTRLLGCFRWR